MAATYYKRSGRISPIPFLGAIIGGIIAATGLAYVYSFVIFYNPIIYISFFATLIFGGLVGFIVGLVASSLKSRSGAQDFVASAIVAVIALWIYWAFWAGLTNYGDPTYSFLPFLDKLSAGPMAAYNYVFNGLSYDYQISIGRRARSSGGLSPSTMELIWWVETVMILGSATLVGWALGGTTPINEKTNKAADTIVERTVMGLVGDQAALRTAFEAGDFSTLLALDTSKGVPTLDETGANIELLGDEHDPDFNLLTVKSRTFSHDSDGDLQADDSEIVQHLYITPENAAALKAHFGTAK